MARVIFTATMSEDWKDRAAQAIRRRAEEFGLEEAVEMAKFRAAFSKRAVAALRKYGKNAIKSAPYKLTNPEDYWRASRIKDSPGDIRITSPRANIARAPGYTRPPGWRDFTPYERGGFGDFIHPIRLEINPLGDHVFVYTDGFRPHARGVGRAPYEFESMPPPEGFFTLGDAEKVSVMTAYPTTGGDLAVRPTLAEVSPGQWIVEQPSWTATAGEILDAAADGAFFEVVKIRP